MGGNRDATPPAAPFGVRRAWRILRLSFGFRRDPASFYRATSAALADVLAGFGMVRPGTRVLDAGSGTGALSEVLASRALRVVALDVADHRAREIARTPFVLGLAERLPFADGAFDGVISSNVLEHVRDPESMLLELARACRPGGFVCVSWTNWLSPWGGHEMAPLHYLGPRLGMRAYRVLHGGKGPQENVPGRTLFVTHIGRFLRWLRRGDSGLRVVHVVPRYWPGLAFLARIPGVREVALWNCVIVLEKPTGAAGEPG
ncbi:MAG TPA: SAM-dependent methyltransferase [Actinobacteria bacterium]|jgi:2-polyprenyl-3-methyl-5-hydroxy-6-metoxy-1,4-benzoquinol methylase|nr:SAM-dependent methyltransferase [Actinomycetota bacterium]HCP61851.1 SAM-dependent methyltransferase [Actinomycetota bacterium]